MVSYPSSLSRYVPVVGLLLLLGAGDEDGKGCRCGPKPPPDPPIDTDVVEAQGFDVELQVVSIDPSRQSAGSSFSAQVFGSNFEAGAKVTIGDQLGQSVRVMDENTISMSVPAMAPGTYDVVVQNTDGERATLRRGLTLVDALPDCTFLRVQFGYDEANLGPEASDAIAGLMPCYQAGSGKIRIEGHADERGTTDYNLALGQRRADSVARHLSTQGVPRSRIETLSYGEERPLNKGHTEEAWGENRRADVHAAR